MFTQYVKLESKLSGAQKEVLLHSLAALDSNLNWSFRNTPANKVSVYTVPLKMNTFHSHPYHMYVVIDAPRPTTYSRAVSGRRRQDGGCDGCRRRPV